MSFGKFVVPFLFAPLVFGQAKLERTFTLTNPVSAPGMQEILTTLRTVTQVHDVSGDAGTSSIKVGGSSGEIALAQWAINGLDRPVAQIRDNAVHEYVVPGPKDDVLRMFYLANMDTPQQIQELLTVLRTVKQIRYVFNYTPLHAISVRGTADEIATAAWLVNELDQPPGEQTDGIHQFQSSDPRFPAIRAFYLLHKTPRDIQETLTSLRMTAHVQNAFSYTSRAVVIIAGTPAQVEESSRLVAERDRAVASVTP